MNNKLWLGIGYSSLFRRIHLLSMSDDRDKAIKDMHDKIPLAKCDHWIVVEDEDETLDWLADLDIIGTEAIDVMRCIEISIQRTIDHGRIYNSA